MEPVIVRMSVMRKLDIGWMLFGGITFAIILAIYVGSGPDHVRLDLSDHSPYRQMIESANAQIVAESEGSTHEPTVTNALGSAKLISTHTASPPRSITETPDGYSLVEFRGEMFEARIEDHWGKSGAHPDDGFDWIGSTTSIEDLVDQAARSNRNWSFGWVRLAEDARVHDLARVLEGTGAKIVGTAGNLIRAKLPGEEARLRKIAALPEVGGIGATPPELKLQSFAQDTSASSMHEPIPVFVTLMSGDSDGSWRRTLKNLGAVVGRFDPTIRVYAVSATFETLKVIAMSDFVMAIEPVSVVKTAHDTAVPAMGADALRIYEGTPGLFSGIGGSTTPIAVMDTGLNIDHPDISSNRSSICGANFVFFEPRIDDHDLWVDAGIHGTHVTGTIVGNGTVEPRYTGMAPLVQHIRFAKVLSQDGFGQSIFILRAMDFLAKRTSCPEGGWSSTQVKPFIVNMSLSASARIWEGRGVSERKLDSIVWRHRQLYVVAQSNEDIGGFSNYGASKNSLAVGAALDSGSIAGFSSHGPTADGRLAPQVVGTGFELYSAAGDGSRDGYIPLNGTSMASPSVAGVAALLMDAVPAHREDPALTRARLMASAVKPDVWIEDTRFFPRDNSNGPGKIQMQYGLGKVSARTSILNKDESDGWVSASAISELEDGEYVYQNIKVPEGTTRLDLVLTWDEPPTDTLASAVLNDLDLFLDHGGDCEPEPCGEYASTSRVDNVEWIIVSDPAPGTYRAKVAGSRIYTDPPRAALAWTMIRGASTPSLDISVNSELVVSSDGNQERELTVGLTTDAYIAAGTRLFIDCRTEAGTDCSRSGRLKVSTERVDGINPEIEATLGIPIDIGELASGEPWVAKFTLGSLANVDGGSFQLFLKASAWNANSTSKTVLIPPPDVDETEVLRTEPPENDLFSDATSITGNQGTVELDLLRAQAELGEPVFTSRLGRPVGSVWYEWTALSNEKVTFNLDPDPDYQSGFSMRIDVYQGDRLTSLEHVASGAWGVQFFAEVSQDYVIRVSHVQKSVPLILNWSTGPRPSNDQFLTAAVIEGVSGGVEGTNEGATLEGEFFGNFAATVWYRWIAPNDGSWWFKSSVEDLIILAFTGDKLAEVRLVSGFPDYRAVFEARGGNEYRLAVASRNAFATGLPFELTWETADREAGNDNFRAALEMPSETISSYQVDVDAEATVEPGEPLESGIRTQWWKWTAPEDGDYTWRIAELTRPTTGPGNQMMVSMFSGESLEDLQLVALNGGEMALEWVLSGVGGRQYSFATGFPADYQWAFTSIFASANATLEWGPTPENDSFSSAVHLSGMSGLVTASNLYATTERGERTGKLGHSSLWWKYEVHNSGWYRFGIDDGDETLTFAVYRTGDSLASLVLVDSKQGPTAEMMFYAEEGETYAIRVGTQGSTSGQEFSLRWEETDPPLALRYIGRLAPGGTDIAGNTVELRNLSSMTLNRNGDALYLGSELGLQVFKRDSETGELTYLQLIERPMYLRQLVWDEHRDRLLSVLCYEWQVFTPVEDESGRLRDAERLILSHDHKECNEEDLFIDSGGSFIYAVARHPFRLQAFEFETSDTVRHVQTIEIDELRAAVLSNDDSHVYGVSSTSLLTFERYADTGELTQTMSQRLSNGNALAITSDDEFLFVFADAGNHVSVFGLADDTNQSEPLGSLSYDELSFCSHTATRLGSPSVDVFCGSRYVFGTSSGSFTVAWRNSTDELTITGEVIGMDVLGNPVPDSFSPIDVATSPDGRHVYVATYEDGILAFERLGD